MTKHLEYRLINTHKGKAVWSGITKGDLHGCLQALRLIMGMNATAQRAYEAGYRIVRG